MLRIYYIGFEYKSVAVLQKLMRKQMSPIMKQCLSKCRCRFLKEFNVHGPPMAVEKCR